MLYLANAFSLNMVNVGEGIEITVYSLSVDEAKELGKKAKSIVGHPDTAKLISNMLGFEVPVNRETIKMNKNDEAIIAQYIGPRLPEGTTTLPEGATIQFFLVRIK